MRRFSAASITLRAAVFVSSLSLLAACGSTPRESASQRVDPVSGGRAGSEVRVGELSARELPSGQCGLFLWRRVESPPLVFFFNSTTGRAAVLVDGRERALQRVEVISSPTGDGYGEQVFATPGGEISVRVAIREREDLPDGARITSAVMTVADDRGWSVVLGVGGLAACQP